MSRIVAPVRGQKSPYGYTDKERQEFSAKFAKLAGKMPVSEIAKELGIKEGQVRKFSTVSGWSIKHVTNT